MEEATCGTEELEQAESEAFIAAFSGIEGNRLNRLKIWNYMIGCSGRADNAWCCRICNERCSGRADIVG